MSGVGFEGDLPKGANILHTGGPELKTPSFFAARLTFLSKTVELR